MTSSEIQASFERFMARVAAILTPDELAVYRAYHRRLEERADGEPGPRDLRVRPTA